MGEVTLKLDAALTGKPEAGTEVQFKGVPSAFSKEPFMLTMDAEKANVEGLKVTHRARPLRRRRAPQLRRSKGLPPQGKYPRLDQLVRARVLRLGVG